MCYNAPEQDKSKRGACATAGRWPRRAVRTAEAPRRELRPCANQCAACGISQAFRLHGFRHCGFGSLRFRQELSRRPSRSTSHTVPARSAPEGVSLRTPLPTQPTRGPELPFDCCARLNAKPSGTICALTSSVRGRRLPVHLGGARPCVFQGLRFTLRSRAFGRKGLAPHLHMFRHTRR